MAEKFELRKEAINIDSMTNPAPIGAEGIRILESSDKATLILEVWGDQHFKITDNPSLRIKLDRDLARHLGTSILEVIN